MSFQFTYQTPQQETFVQQVLQPRAYVLSSNAENIIIQSPLEDARISLINSTATSNLSNIDRFIISASNNQLNILNNSVGLNNLKSIATFQQNSNGIPQVGIGTNKFIGNSLLQVNGDTTIVGSINITSNVTASNISVSNLIFNNSINTQNNNINTGSGTITTNIINSSNINSINITTNNITINNNIVVPGNLTIYGTETRYGNTVVNGNVAWNGNTTTNGTATINGSLNVTTGAITTANVTINTGISIGDAGLFQYTTSNNATVTQLTSKSTAVTANGRTGQITTSSASLAKSSAVSFTVNNNQVVSTKDIIMVCIASGGTLNSYQVCVDSISVGAFTICITNNGTGALAEALIINFAILRVN